MARKSKKLSNYEAHQLALRRFDTIQSTTSQVRRTAVENRRFVSNPGGQWEGSSESEQFKNKPQLEVNKLHHAILYILSEYRNNQITVDFVERDGAGSSKTADALTAMFRAVEHDSTAEEAYLNAFDEAVKGGMGAWRVCAEYEDEEDDDNEQQEVKIEPIFDADSSVFFDLGAKRQDKADARYCFVVHAVDREQYEDQYDDSPETWPKDDYSSLFDWAQPDVVYVAEYYVIEEAPKTIHVFMGPDGEEEKYDDDELEDNDGAKRIELEGSGFIEVRLKKTKTKQVRKYIMSGGGILEDCGVIPGKCIPIVPLFGHRWYVSNVEWFTGHVQYAKDAQRLKNMQYSKLAEISALGSVEKPIFTEEQVKGHEYMWAEDNVRDWPYLLVNPMIDAGGNPVAAGPVGYTKAPEIPPALAALLQLTEQDMRDILGGYGQEQEIHPNVSGKAVELVQNKVDMKTFIYVSNMSRAIKRTGQIFLSMAKDIYVEPKRKVRGLAQTGEAQQIELMQPARTDEGTVEYQNDFSKADLDVFVTVGPTSDTKRQATVKAITGLMTLTQDPTTQQILTALALSNMDGEGFSDVRAYFRKQLLRQGVLVPTDQEQQELAAEAQAAAQQPDPQTQYLQAAADQAASDAAARRADTILTISKAETEQAKADETRAKTIATLATVAREDQDRAISELEKLKAYEKELGLDESTQAQSMAEAQPAAKQPVEKGIE